MAARIEDYALIGDCRTAALISKQGSVDWLCWPRFDSGACFAALLGNTEHGRWLLTCADRSARVSRRYLPDTLILETRYVTARGAATVIDFMPVGQRHSHLVRLIVGERGQVSFRTELIVRFDYGALIPWVTQISRHRHSFVAGADRVLLDTRVELRGEQLKTVGECRVRAGQRLSFVLTYGPSYQGLPAPTDPHAGLRATERFWRRWTGRCSGAGEYADAVRRSLITIKALTFAPSGGIVAAPTTSLPERLGGQRNWDYRYCWVRDSTFALQALMNSGYYAEAKTWREWLLRAAAGDPSRMQIMYGIAGERLVPEWEASWLPGYRGSSPVRIGNAACEQLQLDICGELMDTLHHGRLGKLAQSEAGWQLQQELIAHLETVWREPDCGMWEVRGKPRHFTYSKAMAWVALDRVIRSAECFDLRAPLRHWRRLRDRMHADVCRHGFNRRLGSFVRSYGSYELDASLLLLPIVGFLPASDPRMRGTVAAIERTLIRDGFVERYRTRGSQDGLPPGEGVFLACSFWLADALV
ncbi:MAG: glycoside hydrolase family 15 protein, partial [Gammaproteobacteria bacterium]|nr:glycoside hydrolase family 15 protein [Gammaproteobacteria bacterium]